MPFLSCIGFDFKPPSLSAFTHAYSKKGHAAKARHRKYLVVHVGANLYPKVFPILTHHPFEKSEKNLVRVCYHGTIMQARINTNRTTPYTQKTEIFLVTRSPTC